MEVLKIIENPTGIINHFRGVSNCVYCLKNLDDCLGYFQKKLTIHKIEKVLWNC